MGTAIDLALITIDPESGRSLLGLSESDAVFGGAILVDLALAGRLDITGSGAKARVRLANADPIADDALDQALVRLKPNLNPKASALVPRLGKGARPRLVEQLIAERAVRARTHKVLGLFPVTRHTVIDQGRRQEIAGAVVDVLTGRTDPDDATGPLIALMSVGNVVKQVVPPSERKTAVRRAKKIAEGEWAGAASKAAIDAANTAVAAAMTASIVATSSAATGT